ncbi:MAG: hypothetical protein F6K11_19820 [Leptolyngbya sp. SIO3F4]|nr:hypothetical protein [Leptolyngbya sp. SIO3F4]
MPRPTDPNDSLRLLGVLAFLVPKAAVRDKDGIHRSQTANQFGKSSSALTKTVSAYIDGTLSPDSPLMQAKSLLTHDLVQLLIRLKNNLQNRYRRNEISYSKLLSREDIFIALQKLIELTPDERSDLGISYGDKHLLIQRAITNIYCQQGNYNNDALMRLYKTSLESDIFNVSDGQYIELSQDNLMDFIAKVVERSIERKYGFEKHHKFSELKIRLAKKVRKQVIRLMVKSGSSQIDLTGRRATANYIEGYCSTQFIEKLASSIIDNERLSQDFPIRIKSVTVEDYGFLPLVHNEELNSDSHDKLPILLNHALIALSKERIAENKNNKKVLIYDLALATQSTTKVTVYFRLRQDDNARYDFSFSSIGAGGTLSHITRIINRTLLSGIECMREYFPMAHDMAIVQEAVKDNTSSPLWSHILVKLCKNEVINTAVSENRNGLVEESDSPLYEKYSFSDPIGRGDFCGFDWLSNPARALLKARLDAIRNIQKDPKVYMKNLFERMQNLALLEKGKSCFKEYPFSSLATAGFLEEKFSLSFAHSVISEKDSYVIIDACLFLIEAFLKEGSYRHAKKYLKYVENFLESDEIKGKINNLHESSFNYGSRLIQYEICQAWYAFAFDRAREIDDQSNILEFSPRSCSGDSDQRSIIRETLNSLERAEKYAQLRLSKYAVIGEVSQATFDPHYSLLSKIYLLRSKILLFFPDFVPYNQKYIPTDDSDSQRSRPKEEIQPARLYLLEKARLYAAANGDLELYINCTAYQTWFYLIVSLLENEGIKFTHLNILRQPNSSIQNLAFIEDKSLTETVLSPSECMIWACKLRDHALLAYAECGRLSYYQIKEKSGTNITSTYGAYRIQPIPLIWEATGEEYEKINELDDRIILDMSLFAVPTSILQVEDENVKDDVIYLFGPNACYLFFVRGLYHLCSNDNDEFASENAQSQKDINWEEKLKHTARLFNISWAISEDGGDVKEVSNDSTIKYDVNRPFTSRHQPSHFTSQGVNMILDLYPCHISEISDLSKIFAAATLVLLRFCVKDSSERNAIEDDIDNIFQDLHNENYFNSETVQKLSLGQSRYNGNIATHIAKAREIIETYIHTHDVVHERPRISRHRNQLLTQLFSIF